MRKIKRVYKIENKYVVHSEKNMHRERMKAYCQMIQEYQG